MGVSANIDGGFAATLEAVAKKLKKLGVDVDGAARRAVIDATKKTLEESVRRCPVDEGDLEDSHAMEIEGKGTRTEGTIYIPDNSPAGPYALRMHEDLYKLGPYSLAKQAVVGVQVGAKYMERAVEDTREERIQEMFDELRKVIG